MLGVEPYRAGHYADYVDAWRHTAAPDADELLTFSPNKVRVSVSGV
jgi:hypothetical protein